MPSSCTVQHGKEKYHVSLDGGDGVTVAEFLQRVATASGVPVDCQKKLLTKKHGELGKPERANDPVSKYVGNGDTLALFGTASKIQDIPKEDRPIFDSDLKEALKVCSAVHVPGEPIQQPSFAMTYFAETEPDGPIYPVCGPCAHSCWGMKHIHVLDTLDELEQPFCCTCCQIVKTDHKCFWKGTEPERKMPKQMTEAWKIQFEKFMEPIREEILAKNAANEAKQEEQMTQRIKSQLELFEQYRDPDAQEKARGVIPTSALTEKAKTNPIGGEKDFKDAFLRQLLHWFKHSFFKWTTSPKCDCTTPPSDTKPDGNVVPNPEEKANWASVVEHYLCKACGKSVRFPRYNKATRLLTWRQGRCGEWTNCFALLCVSLGYETRYVLDMTDHVWVEVFSTARNRWIHCDPCEDAFDAPTMYESGWKKKLTYIFAMSDIECLDVIRRYSVNSLQLNRNECSEPFLSRLVLGLNESQRRRAPTARQPILDERREQELAELALVKRYSSNDGSLKALTGRTTGSEEWRRQRGELGEGKGSTALVVPAPGAKVPVYIMNKNDVVTKKDHGGPDVESDSSSAAPTALASPSSPAKAGDGVFTSSFGAYFEAASAVQIADATSEGTVACMSSSTADRIILPRAGYLRSDSELLSCFLHRFKTKKTHKVMFQLAFSECSFLDRQFEEQTGIVRRQSDHHHEEHVPCLVFDIATVLSVTFTWSRREDQTIEWVATVRQADPPEKLNKGGRVVALAAAKAKLVLPASGGTEHDSAIVSATIALDRLGACTVELNSEASATAATSEDATTKTESTSVCGTMLPIHEFLYQPRKKSKTEEVKVVVPPRTVPMTITARHQTFAVHGFVAKQD